VKIWPKPQRLRDRLTLWYVLVLAGVLATYICGATVLFFWVLTAQMFHQEIQDLETVEGLLYEKPDGSLSVHEDYHSHPEHKLLLERLMEVRAPDGRLLYRNARLQNRDLGGSPLPEELNRNIFYKRSFVLVGGDRVLMVSHVHLMHGDPRLLRVAYSMEPLEQRMAELIGILFVASPFGLALAALGGYRVAGRALQPVQLMANQAERITASRLDERLPIENPHDELGHLARAFNHLLGRLQESFEQLRRFTADVSHELRTPLAAIRSVGEAGLEEDLTPAQYREVIGIMLEEANRLTQMTETLLTISRADAGQIELKMSTFSMTELAAEAVSLVNVLAEEKGQILAMLSSQDILVLGDRVFLQQAIMNLLDNAVKYSPAGGTVNILISKKVSSQTGREEAVLDVTDSGPGIPVEERPKIFNRFHRVDRSRSQDSGGFGLGLAIAKWAVEANGGHIGMEESTTGGCRFFICLPAI
jgi:heavy metal sensor kinase